MFLPRFVPALNPATAGAELPITEYLELAAATGYAWVELDSRQAPELFALGAERASGLLREHGLRIASFFLPVNWRGEEARFEQDLEPFAALAPFFAALGAERCCTYLFPNQPSSPEESRRRIGRRFERVDRILAASGLRFGLEFLGPMRIFSATPATLFCIGCWICSPSPSPSVPTSGLWSTACTGTAREPIAPPWPRCRRAGSYAHIDDAPAGPLAAQRDDDRLLPGEGVIDLVGFIRSLAAAGYAGPIGIEIDGPYLRADSPDRAARRARSAWDMLFARPELAA